MDCDPMGAKQARRDARTDILIMVAIGTLFVMAAVGIGGIIVDVLDDARLEAETATEVARVADAGMREHLLCLCKAEVAMDPSFAPTGIWRVGVADKDGLDTGVVWVWRGATRS